MSLEDFSMELSKVKGLASVIYAAIRREECEDLANAMSVLVERLSVLENLFDGAAPAPTPTPTPTLVK